MTAPSPVPASIWSLVTLTIAAGCGGGSTDVARSRVASVTLVPSSVVLDAIGATAELTATARDALGNEVSGTTFTWTTSDENIVTVDGSGTVTAVSVGTAEVAATAEAIARSTSVTVTQVAAELAMVSGDGQTATVTTALNAPFVIEVRDRLGHAISDAVVAFSIRLGSGTLTAARDTSGSDGRASTALTFGTAAGLHEVVAAVTVGTASAAVFSATALADVADAVALVGGDGQRQPAGVTLPDEMVIQVTDQYGNGVQGESVGFTVTQGGGSVDPAAALSDETGEARAVWRVGTIGPQTVEADVGGLNGSPVIFTAVGTDLAITTVTPDPLREGEAGQIVGVGFDPVIENDTVLVGGIEAIITNATETTIDFTVPTGACEPQGLVPVAVSTALGGTTPPTDHEKAPVTLAMAVGELLVLQDPASFCLQFAAAVADEQYLVGVQSTTSSASSVTTARLVSVTSGGVPAAPVTVAAPMKFRGASGVLASDRAKRWRRHRDAEVALRAAERRALEPFLPVVRRAAARGAAQALVDSNVGVGQIISMKLPNLTTSVCTDFVSVTAVVKAKGEKGIWLADQNNPAGGFTDNDYQDLSDQLDSFIYNTDVAYFGDPTDLDRNGRVVILITQELNTLSPNTLGFVSPADVFSTADCPGSNFGELYYGKAPDGDYPREHALEDAPAIIAHEFSHIIQVGRRLIIGPTGQFMNIFMAEGQATLAEEVVGHAALGNAPGDNLGFAVGFNDPQTAPVGWYTAGLGDLAFYFGNNTVNADVSIPGAPNECGWLTDDPSPCMGRALWYGVTWSLLRWISDHHGADFAGGEQEIHQRLIDNTTFGFDNIQGVVGVPIEDLLAEWSAAMYLDDRVAGVPERLTMPSWNYMDIFELGGLNASASLVVETLSFGDFSDGLEVKTASTKYYVLGGANRPATAVRVRDNQDAELPSFMQVFLVRTQ